MRPMGMLLLKVWHAKESSMEPRIAPGESHEVFIARREIWLKTHWQTNQLIEFLGHAGVTFASKINFMKNWL
jgi:hypothetical protein